MMVTLQLLGGLALEGPGGVLTGPAMQRKRLALLALLALAPAQRLSRERLLAYLWPESEPERARHQLSSALYELRKAAGEEAIVAAGDELRLNPTAIKADVAEFEAALARGEHERAVALYRGSFLDGFFLSEAPEFERWVDRERDRLADAYAGALEALAEAAEALQESPGAVQWWKARAAQDPYDSRVALRLMQALDASGNRPGAIQHAAVHERLLQEDLGIEPAPEVRAFAERLRREPTLAPTPAGEEHAPESGTGIPAGSPAREEDRAPSEPAHSPASSALPRAIGRPLTSRIAALVLVGLLGLLAMLAVVWLLPETSAHPGTSTEVAAASPAAIAVLPFVNLSRDPEEEYFSDGLTEELISALSEVRALRVVARTSAFAFKGENRDIREIGQRLNVGTVLEGSVRKAGERVRVTAQLINAADGFHLWSQTYEREVTDITDLFAVWSDLALQIASALEAELTPAERARLARRPTTSPEAYALYLKGRHFWNQRTGDGFRRAIEYYERAIEIDPRYAAAHAGLAYVFSMQGLSGDLPPQDARERMRRAVLNALELDEESAEAHAALGAHLNIYEWDSEASERAYLRALELDPSYGTARHLYANLLRSVGRLDEALAQRRKAVELDPLAPQLSTSLGAALLEAGHAEEGLANIRNALELDSTFAAAHAGLGDFYVTTGQLQEAVRAHQRAVALAGASLNSRTGLARVLALAGRKAEARRMLAELQADAARGGIYVPVVATVFLALDDVEGALAWLERSYRQRHPGLRLAIGRLRDARLDGDPRYRDLRRRIGLPR